MGKGRLYDRLIIFYLSLVDLIFLSLIIAAFSILSSYVNFGQILGGTLVIDYKSHGSVAYVKNICDRTIYSKSFGSVASVDSEIYMS